MVGFLVFRSRRGEVAEALRDRGTGLLSARTFRRFFRPTISRESELRPQVLGSEDLLG